MKELKKFLDMIAFFCMIGLILYFAPEIYTGADSIYHELMLPIFLGYLLTYLFYVVTVFLPAKERTDRIRPKLELQEYEVYLKLFHIMDILFFRYGFQDKIRGGLLKLEDFNLALQNKCLHRSSLYEDKYSNTFEAIGDKLEQFSKEIEIIIEKIMVFHDYLSENEIDLLGEIRIKLFAYDFNFDKKAIGLILKPKHHNIVYMHKNYFDIYQLFLNLQTIVFNNKYKNKDIVFGQIQYYFYSKQYEKCNQFAKEYLDKYLDHDREWIEIHQMLSLYKLANRKEEVYEKIEKLFKNQIDILSWRNEIDVLKDDIFISKLLNQYYSQDKIDSMNRTLEIEKAELDSFIAQNNEIRDNYTNK